MDTCSGIFGLIFGLISQLAFSQSAWVKRAGGNSTDLANGLWVDKQENAYLAGSISGQARFYRTQVASLGGGDVVVSKFNASGIPVWVRLFGGKLDDFAKAITGDPEGNLYITGVFTDTAYFEGFTLVSPKSDVFVVKLNPKGSVVWAKALGTRGSALPEVISVTDQGSVYVGGLFSGTYDAETKRQMGQTDGFVTRLDWQGAISWTRVFGGPGFDEINMLSTDAWGRVLVGGNFDQFLYVEDQEFVGNSAHSSFILRLEATGSVLWTRTFSGFDAQSSISDAITDLEGNVYLTGKFSGETQFTQDVKIAKGQTDVFLMSIRTDGTIAWVSHLGGSDVDEGLSIRFNEDQSSLLVGGVFNKFLEMGKKTLKGEYDNQVFIARFDRRGNLDEIHRQPFNSTFKLEGKYLNPTGNFWLCGSFTGSVFFGTQQLHSAGEEDLFIAGISDSKVAR